MDQRRLLRRLADMQYTRNELDLTQGTYRVRGDVVDIFPGGVQPRKRCASNCSTTPLTRLRIFDPLTGQVLRKVPRFTIYPERTT